LRGSRGEEHATPTEIELGTTVHLPLQAFEFGDLSFRLTVAPRRRERGADRHAILRQPTSERLDGTDAAGEGFVEPGIEGGASALRIGRAVPHECREPLHEGDNPRGLAVLCEVP